jgi:hypothetical protein
MAKPFDPLSALLAFTYLFISSDRPERLEKILTISDAEG